MKIRNRELKKLLLFVVIFCSVNKVFSQDPDRFRNAAFLKRLNSEGSFSELKKQIVSESKKTPAGKWGEFVNGVDEVIQTRDKTVAFTFDACGGKNEKGK